MKMSFLFGKRKTSAGFPLVLFTFCDLMSEMIDKSIREIEREKTRSSSSRKEADHGAKKNAEQGQMGAVGVTAKTWYERDIRLKSSRSLNHNSRH
ncbi:hypothetical protein MANES_11G021700v8 [Manihot esculenta]|uniref:Uncharacterized protein n=1 Tax=Manihot esculenta TaxID=3983 RepID=A0ACB7GTG6_MANES|nr:hypothetical protein MANES_11G021700v8 [Manihot esculenta]